MAIAPRHHANRLARNLAVAAWLSVTVFLAASSAFRSFCAEFTTAAGKL